MKYLKFLLVGVAMSCNSATKKAPEMPGAYLMVSQTVFDGNTKTKLTEVKQLKIYTDEYFMFSQVIPSDSTASFGVGTYSSDTSGVIEKLAYTSADSSFKDSLRTYKLSITPTADGYNQIIPDIVINNAPSKLTETYITVGKKQSTPLDGVWKQTKSYDVKGNDTLPYNRTEYKAFYNGYFMFGITNKDSTGKISTGVGFGTYSMEGANQLKETDLNSSYSIIAGESFLIDLKFDGNGKYVQTITHPDSSKTVEYYERLKLNK
ncbi:MAG: hypothetical protein ACTHM5_12375 [Ginsengibacter sp.]